MEEDLIAKKAELLIGGDVLLPEGYRMPFRISRSTAGPGAGKRSAVFSFGNVRVKKGISYDSGDFELIDDNGSLSLRRNGKEFIDAVEIMPVVFHSPEQAFFNLDQRCIYNCRFCTSPLLKGDVTRSLTDEKIVEMIRDSMKEQKVISVALTSGVIVSAEETVKRMVSCVRAVRKEFPDIPIGVEPYVDSVDQIIALKHAGADEMKINLETPREDIFKNVCPELNYSLTLEMLKDSVKIFGRGKVTTNLIFGIGESDDDLYNCMSMLASFGCVPGLRGIRLNDMNRESMMSVCTIDHMDKERMIRLAHMQKKILEEHDLTTLTFRTMCFECGCCDLVPFRDL
ncbi:MAG: radical SAM protein [Methanomassiliicoccaceae archaeon]|jgi:biotin synthase-related radical SAM superfamily protein|nr:radical SAM protein [Methanomassiliicoccaceae archaeon]